MDDLMTSKSFEGNNFSNYEILDAKIAHALKKIISSVSKSSELKNTTDLYEEGRLLTWSMNTFEPPELMKLYTVYQIFSENAYTMMTLKNSTRGSSSISSM